MTEPTFSDLRAFLDRLRRDGDLVTIEAEVDARLEVAEIHRRVIAAGGPALLFTRVRGAGFPLATNLFGTARRASLAFGRRPQQLIERIVHLAETILPPTASKLWAARDVAREALRIGLASRARGPVTEVITSDPRLDRLPALTLWPEDGGPFITLPLVYTEHPERPGHNLGMYRMQVYDGRTTGMHWQIGKGGGFHYAAAEARGERLPVTVFLGGPPALMLAAIAPLPENVPELMLASLIAGPRLRRVPGIGPHPLMADAEFALMGSVAPGARRPEGPFGDHYGYYSLQHDYPVFAVEKLAHRRDAVYPATVVGPPPMEDLWLGKATERLFLPVVRVLLPEVKDMSMPVEGGFHNLVLVSIHKSYPGQARKVMCALWGLGLMMLAKAILVVDDDTDVQDASQVAWRALNNVDPRRDLMIVDGPLDALDHASPAPVYGSKVGIDATRKLPEEGHARQWPQDITMSPEVVKRVTERWGEIMGSAAR